MSNVKINFKDPNNITFDEALAYIEEATACFHENRHEDFVSGFSENARIRYASFPEMRGRDELQGWMNKRKVRQLDGQIDFYGERRRNFVGQHFWARG